MKNKNVKDIAKERTFANQSDEYNEEFARWRAQENNPYGYKYVHDEREHSYVVDEGYLKNESDVAERMALFKCLSLLGISLLVMLFICVLRNYFFSIFYPGFACGKIYFHNRSGLEDNLSASAAAALCLFDSAKFLIPALLFATVTRIPARVALPARKTTFSLTASAVSMMLVAVIIGRLCQYATSALFGLFGVDTLYMIMYTGDSPWVSVISFITYCIIIPVSSDIFFRGVVLQTFRQFGDTFAITVSASVGAFVCYDASNIGYSALLALVLGFFTIKTGSVKVSIIMNIFASSVNYLLSMLRLYGTFTGKIIELCVCALIVGISVIAFSKLTARNDWNFNISGDNTEMTFFSKLKIFFTTDTILIWLVAAFIFILISYKGA